MAGPGLIEIVEVTIRNKSRQFTYPEGFAQTVVDAVTESGAIHKSNKALIEAIFAEFAKVEAPQRAAEEEQWRLEDEARRRDFGLWQPIATAPKDGSRIVVCEAGDQDTLRLVYWERLGEEDRDSLGVTHWLPIPDVPAAQEAAA